jgi:hypothetical protein
MKNENVLLRMQHSTNNQQSFNNDLQSATNHACPIAIGTIIHHSPFTILNTARLLLKTLPVWKYCLHCHFCSGC